MFGLRPTHREQALPLLGCPRLLLVAARYEQVPGASCGRTLRRRGSRASTGSRGDSLPTNVNATLCPCGHLWVWRVARHVPAQISSLALRLTPEECGTQPAALFARAHALRRTDGRKGAYSSASLSSRMLGGAEYNRVCAHNSNVSGGSTNH
jgi:hypothetical protein